MKNILQILMVVKDSLIHFSKEQKCRRTGEKPKKKIFSYQQEKFLRTTGNVLNKKCPTVVKHSKKVVAMSDNQLLSENKISILVK